jgi:NAD(P)-dependent dehydrogenase (short-subunit alcohol dehydrogenase family)
MSDYFARMRLDGRAAVVLGAGGGGMGTQTCLALAEAGAVVAAVDLVEARAQETVALVEAAGGTAVALAADVTRPGVMTEIFGQAERRLGPVRHLVNVIGGVNDPRARASLVDCPDEAYDAVFAANIDYVFAACREAARVMTAHGLSGSIVNFASISAVTSAPLHGLYGAAKAGVMALTRTFSVELGPQGIRVNAVVPGSIRVPHHGAQANEALEARSRLSTPIGRRLYPEEVAGTVLFLLSELAAGITGQCLNVDGGVTANHPFGTLTDFNTRNVAASADRAGA